MFSTIDDQIEQTNGQPVSRTQKLLRVLGMVGVATLLFGGLYLGILLME
jgi:hypothetical protein